MEHKRARNADKQRSDKAKGQGKRVGRRPPKLKFDKPLGSSHRDELDMRDVAKEARKKSK